MKENQKNRAFRVMAFGLLLVCIVCLIWLATYFMGQKKAAKELEDLTASYIQSTDVTESSEESTTPEPESTEESQTEESQEEETDPLYCADLSIYGLEGRTIDFESLKAEKNADIYAWITVPGTVIDYPVVQHPEEMDYYLDHNLDGSKGYPGCIYTQRINAKDWTDTNTVLYGHNMKNGTMFAALHKFKDEKFFNDNRYIYIYTEDGKVLVYTIFAAYVYGNDHLLYTYRYNTEEDILYYVDTIYSHDGLGDHMNRDLTFTGDSKIITLSTCIANKPDKRFLVQGVLTAWGE